MTLVLELDELDRRSDARCRADLLAHGPDGEDRVERSEIDRARRACAASGCIEEPRDARGSRDRVGAQAGKP